MKPISPRRTIFQVALSFAGEDRPFVSEVATALSDSKILVFYDQFFEAELVGKELVSNLRKTYEEAQYCVVFVSKSYAQKKWSSRVELPSILAKSVVSTNDYLLPVLLDDTRVDGIPDTIGFIDGRSKSPRDVAAVILKKLRLEPAFMDEDSLFALLMKDALFVKRFVAEFSGGAEAAHVRYDLGSAARRFFERQDFGNLLQTYGLGEMDTNLGKDELDIYLRLLLSMKGRRLRGKIYHSMERDQWETLGKAGWYHD